MEKANEAEAKNRRQVIIFRVTDEESAAIKAKAEKAGLTVSDYLRNAGLNKPIRSVYDSKAVADLTKLNADMGRVAGLLKLWIMQKPGEGVPVIEVEEVMRRFRELQEELTSIMHLTRRS